MAEPSKTEEPPPQSEIAARLTGLKDAMSEMRAHLRRTGAGFGAGATAVLAGLGYTQLHELFPIPPTHRVWIAAAALVGVVLAFAGAVVLAGRFFSAQRRVRVTAALGGPDIRGKDKRVQQEVYDETAREEGAASLEAVELRAERIDRVARATSDENARAALQAEAARLKGQYIMAIHGAAASIVERRSRDAFKGSRLWAFVTVAGIILAFGAADYAKGEREKVELLKECQPLVKDAPEACDSVRSVSATKELGDQAGRDAGKLNEELAAARSKFASSSADVSALERLEACSKVLISAPGFQGAGDVTKAAIATACLALVQSGAP